PQSSRQPGTRWNAEEGCLRMSMTQAASENAWRRVKSDGRRFAARMARRALPNATVCLAHVEPDLTLRVHLRRNLMLWSGGLARFEPPCVRVLRAVAGRGDVVFDIGANIGFFSTLLSRWVGPEGRVVAVEPDPENLALLRRNLDENRCTNARVCASAIGAHRGFGDFSRDEATGATG